MQFYELLKIDIKDNYLALFSVSKMFDISDTCGLTYKTVPLDLRPL